MGILRCGGIFTLVSAAVILSISFFVLWAARKSDSQGIKTFGLIVAVLLWLSLAFIFVGRLTGHHHMMKGMHMMKGRKWHSIMGREMQQEMNKEPAVK